MAVWSELQQTVFETAHRGCFDDVLVEATVNAPTLNFYCNNCAIFKLEFCAQVVAAYVSLASISW